MLKTGIEIEEDIYRFVKTSQLAKEIGGKVYRRDMRPDNAKTEDVVVSFANGTAEQMQFGIVRVNIYVPHIEGVNKANLARIMILQKLIYPIVWENSDEYWITLDELPTYQEVEGLHQTCITAYLRYARMAS